MRARPIRVVGQRKDWDCGIAALAMVLRKPYGDVAVHVRELFPLDAKRGLGLYHLEAIAKNMGTRLRRVYRRYGYLKDNTLGILGLQGEKLHWAGHWVVLKEGVLIDPADERVWGIEEYLRYMKARPCTLLVPES